MTDGTRQNTNPGLALTAVPTVFGYSAAIRCRVPCMGHLDLLDAIDNGYAVGRDIQKKGCTPSTNIFDLKFCRRLQPQLRC